MKSMKNIFRFFSLAVMAVLMMPVMPAHAVHDDLQHPVVVDKGIVKEILKSDMIMLDNDRRYRLENILVPPYEDAPAIDELNQALLNKTSTLFTWHDDKNRHGLPQVHVVTENNVWIQQDLVSKGLAWAFISADTSLQMATALKVLEDGARLKQVGFWRNPIYAIKSPDDVKKFMNSYQIVEGKILSVNIKNRTGSTFLNFGKNWKTDFEVRIKGSNSFLGLVNDPKNYKEDKKNTKNDERESESARADEEDEEQDDPKEGSTAAFIPHQWENRIVRVRGWVHGTSAPIIDVTEKEQIDFVDGR